MEQHKSPWVAIQEQDGAHTVWSGETQIAEFAANDMGTSLDSKANAEIAAAAPAMLAALKGAVEDWRDEMEGDEPISGSDAVDWLCQFYGTASAAVAAAEGTPTAVAKAPDPTSEAERLTVGISVGEFTLEPASDGEGVILSRSDGIRHYLDQGKFAHELAAIDAKASHGWMATEGSADQ